MPTKSGFDSGSGFRRRFRFDAQWALALARRPGLAPARGTAAGKWTAVFREASASIAGASALGDPGGVPSALGRAEAALRARQGEARFDRARKEQAAPGASGANWAARLAEEYRREFHPGAAPRAEPPTEDKLTAADSAAAAAFGAGRLFRRAGLLLRPLFRFVLARSAPILKFAAVALAILAAAGLLAQWRHSGAGAERVQPPEAGKAAARLPGWVKIPEPFHLFNLSAPLIAGQKLDYEARRHSTGGGREDFLSYGEFEGKTPFVRLAVYRQGSEKMAAPAFYVDMARRAAAIGISIDRADPPTPQATRFGEFEMAALSMLKGRLARDNCRGFRLGVARQGVGIAGFACGEDGQPLSGRELAGVINRIDLVSARGDRALRDFFASAEPRPSRRGTK